MAFLRILGAVEIRALAAVALVATGLSIFVYLDAGAATTKGVFTPYESAKMTFLPALVIGAALAALYGAPIYAFVFSRGFAKWPIALLLGLAPGGIVYLLAPNELQFALWVAGSGAAVSLITHFSMRRYGGPLWMSTGRTA